MGYFDFDKIRQEHKCAQEELALMSQNANNLEDSIRNEFAECIKDTFKIFVDVVKEYPELASIYGKKQTVIDLGVGNGLLSKRRHSDPVYTLPYSYSNGDPLIVESNGTLSYLYNNGPRNGAFSYSLEPFSVEELDEFLLGKNIKYDGRVPYYVNEYSAPGVPVIRDRIPRILRIIPLAF